MKKYLSFDIEILNEFEEGKQPDLTKTIPSTAAICTNMQDEEYFYDNPHMTVETATRLVDKMLEYREKSYSILGWNTLSFDLPLIGHYSNRLADCARIALDSTDIMFEIVCHKGFYLGLDKVLTGCNIGGKLHSVELNDKTMFEEMSGRFAPALWRTGEFSAVNRYLLTDIQQPLLLAQFIETNHYVRWTSNAGKVNKVITDLLTVREALKLPLPNTSWMSEVKYRHEYYSWMPEQILKEEGLQAN